jgi:hypothetical protein
MSRRLQPRPFWNHLCRDDGKAESKLPTVLFLLVLGGGSYIGWQFFVPYWNHKVLTDYVKESSVLDAFQRRRPTEEDVANQILKRMRELGIHFVANNKDEHLEVINKSAIAYEIRLRYKQTLELPGRNPEVRHYEIHFDGSDLAKATIPK